MMLPKYIPEIRPAILWDTPPENVDYEKHSDFIICRVFNRGNIQEIADVVVCYGDDYVRTLLLTSDNLDNFGLEIASALLNIPQQNFKCYEKKQFPRSY